MRNCSQVSQHEKSWEPLLWVLNLETRHHQLLHNITSVLNNSSFASRDWKRALILFSTSVLPADTHQTQNTLFLPTPPGLWEKPDVPAFGSSFSLLDLVFRHSSFSEWLSTSGRVIHLAGFPEFMWHSHQGSDYSGFPPLASLAHQYCQCTHYDACLLVRLVGLFLNRSHFFFKVF